MAGLSRLNVLGYFAQVGREKEIQFFLKMRAKKLVAFETKKKGEGLL